MMSDQKTHDVKIAVLETENSHINATLLDIKNSLVRIEDKFDKRFEAIDGKLERRFDKIDNRIWMLTFWVIGGFVGVLSLLAHVAHWI